MNAFLIVLGTFILCALIAIALIVDEHPDTPYKHTNSKVKEYCDTPLPDGFRIDTLNSGKLVLMRGSSKAMDGNRNYVTGYDTCYLKLRAYRFWLNEVKE